jgi:hypothetical protein
MINVFEANRTVENKANKIPEPFTKPACINAEAGVGEVIAEATNDERINSGLNYSGRDDAQARKGLCSEVRCLA